MTRFLAALALACACSPAMAEGAAEPITRGDVASGLGMLGGAAIGLIVIAVGVGLALGLFRDRSH